MYIPHSSSSTSLYFTVKAHVFLMEFLLQFLNDDDGEFHCRLFDVIVNVHDVLEKEKKSLFFKLKEHFFMLHEYVRRFHFERKLISL